MNPGAFASSCSVVTEICLALILVLSLFSAPISFGQSLLLFATLCFFSLDRLRPGTTFVVWCFLAGSGIGASALALSFLLTFPLSGDADYLIHRFRDYAMQPLPMIWVTTLAVAAVYPLYTFYISRVPRSRKTIDAVILIALSLLIYGNGLEGSGRRSTIPLAYGFLVPPGSLLLLLAALSWSARQMFSPRLRFAAPRLAYAQIAALGLLAVHAGLLGLLISLRYSVDLLEQFRIGASWMGLGLFGALVNSHLAERRRERLKRLLLVALGVAVLSAWSRDSLFYEATPWFVVR